MAVVRSDNGDILGVHGAESYRIHPYQEWLLDNVALILDQDLSIGSAGLLKGGAVAWVQVERPENLELAAGVTLRPWILARTSHDGSLKSGYSAGATNVVCDNTLAAGVREGEKNGTLYTVRHTSRGEFQLGSARQAMGIMFKMEEEFAKEVDTLTSTKVSDAEWQQFLDSLVPVPEDDGAGRTRAMNKQAKLGLLWRNDERVAPWTGTAWGVLQAVSTFNQHEATIRGMDRPERNMLSTVYGKFQEQDSKTLKRLEAVLA
jgi:phage/plasmid-like protein (TIGR03299 family)